jgi:hypothetical protein
MKKISIILICAVAAMMQSCTHYLDIKPYGRTIPKTAEEFSALLHTHLNDIDVGEDEYMVGNASTSTDFDAAAGDDFEACLTDQAGRNLRIYLGTLVGSYGPDNTYSKLYEVIRDCNIVLNEMDETGTEEANKVRATAYAMRGVCYYQLLRMFCEAPSKGNFDTQLGMPLVKTFDMEDRPVRSTMQQTIDLIEQDFDKSLEYNMTDDIYRFTADVVKGYKTRLYFWTEQWDKALPLAKELLESHPLLSGDDYKTMMQTTYDMKGNEILKSYRSVTVSSSTALTASRNIIQYRPVSTRFLNAFSTEEKSTDIRYSLFINNKRQAVKIFFSGLRSAEFKLIEAECDYHLGDEAGALKAINELRAHRITGYKNLTMSNLPSANPSEVIKQDAEGKNVTPLLSLILNERRKEMFLESDRFFELKRNGTPEFWIAYNARKYTTKAYMYTFPIPEREIELNAALAQNPGYTEVVSSN